MPSVYPGALPPAGSASSTDTLAAAGHTSLHNTDRDGILAVATKIGTGSSTPVANTVLRGIGAGTSAWGQVSLSGDVIGTLPIGSGGTGVTTLAEFKTTFLALLHPVGSIYINATDSTNPGTLLGFGTWVAFGQGRVMVGLNSGDTDFDTAEEAGGAKTHTLTVAEMPAHTHNVAFGAAADGAGASQVARTDAGSNIVKTSTSTGGGSAHNNLQPYIVVYMWKRTA